MSAQNTGTEVWSPIHLRLAVDSAQVALWSWNMASDHLTMDKRAFDLWGLPFADAVAFEQLSANVHPADRERVGAAFAATQQVTGSFEIDFRIMLNDIVRWVSARGQGADPEMPDRTIFGIFIDVTGRKQAEEGNELLAGEMSHRVKNLLSIATGLTNMTYRSVSTTRDMAQHLTQRLTALGRAHDLVRPLPGSDGEAALLGDLLTVLLSPYDDQGAFAGRIRVAVTRMGVGEAAATALAMIIHELATNSLKYGALSCDTGFLDVSTTVDDTTLTLTWAESGGPEITDTPALQGFGSRMLDRSLTYQLAGSIEYDWRPTGLVATMTMRKDRIAV